MKSTKIFSCLFLSLLLLGCHIDLELWVEPNGAGKGIVLLTGGPNDSKNELEKELVKLNFQITKVIENENRTVQADVKWDNFEKVFQERRQNKNGSITLDFTKIFKYSKGDRGEVGDFAFVKIHVPGKIDKENTKGHIKSKDTVNFYPGELPIVTYFPRNPIIFYVVGTAMGLIITILILLLIFKKSRTKNLE